MAEFEVKMRKLQILEHPNADALEIAQIDGFQAIVPKGKFYNGDVAAYIPEQSVVPDWLLKEMGLEGRLAGSQKNRVIPVRLRGVFSEGLVFYATWMDKYHEGDDVAEALGITKFEPPVPVQMTGKWWNAAGRTIRFDIEALKKEPEAFSEDRYELVVVTEKLHGTWCCVGKSEGEWIVNSKGVSARGFAFRTDDPETQQNLYVKAWERHRDIIEEIAKANHLGEDYYFLGEIVGPGVQDLTYGLKEPRFFIFDVYIGKPGRGRYADWGKDSQLLRDVERHLDAVPFIYEGRYQDTIKNLATGNTTLPFDGTELDQIREGIVIKPVHERHDPGYGRACFKVINEDYALRKGGTEFN